MGVFQEFTNMDLNIRSTSYHYIRFFESAISDKWRQLELNVNNHVAVSVLPIDK